MLSQNSFQIKQFVFHSLNAKVAIIQKPINWFAQQTIDWFYIMKTLVLNELWLLDNLFQTILTHFYQIVSSKQFSMSPEISVQAIVNNVI